MRLLLLSLSLCITANLLSQRTIRANSYITTNISYDSDPENKKINRLNNLNGEVSSLTSYMYNISRGDQKIFDKQESFKYSFNRNAEIETEWKFKQADQSDEKISYQSFIRNRKSQVASFMADRQVDIEEYEYDVYNRLIKTSTTIAGKQTEIPIPISKEDSLDVFQINGYSHSYYRDRLMSVKQDGSKFSKHYDYRRANTLKKIGNYKRAKMFSGSGIRTSDGVYHHSLDGVNFTHKGLVSGVWNGTYNAGDEWLGSLSSFYDYNDDNQVIEKYRQELNAKTIGWLTDSTIFIYVYNEQKLLTSIIKDNNQAKPMVTFDYNEYDDMIYSVSPVGELKYVYSDYDAFNNWRTREKYLNGVLKTREERVIEYFD